MLAELLRERIAELGINMSEAARRCGMNPAMMHQLLNDSQRTPRPDTLDRLANGLGIDISRLYERIGIAMPQHADQTTPDPQRRLLEGLLVGCDLDPAHVAILEQLEQDSDRFAALQTAVRQHIRAAIRLAGQTSAA